MRVPGHPDEIAADRDGWAGSNVDLPTPSEIDAELLYRVRMADDALEEADRLQAVYLEAMRLYFLAFAESVRSSALPSNAAREREAKSKHVGLRTAYQSAKLRYEFAERTVTNVCDAMLKATQSRARLVRRQLDLDGHSPSFPGS